MTFYQYVWRHGRCIRNNINHQEHVIGDTKYFVMWRSKRHLKDTEPWGWLVYKTAPISPKLHP